MIRTLTAILAVLVLCTTMCGCSGGTPEDEAMTERRDAPPKRKPPGASGDVTLGQDETTDKPPPPPGE